MVGSLARRSRIVRPALQCTRSGSGIVAKIPHTSTLPDRTISQSDSKELHAAIRTSPRVVPIVAAMRAPPRHRSAAAFRNRTQFQLDQRIRVAWSDPKPEIRVRFRSSQSRFWDFDFWMFFFFFFFFYLSFRRWERNREDRLNPTLSIYQPWINVK